MGERKIGGAVASNLSNVMLDFSVAEATLDGASDQKLNMWINKTFNQNLGYYNEIPEVGVVVDAKAMWTIGKGYKADPETTMILDSIKGNGTDTFNSIIENAVRIMEIGGDALAEIMWDGEENLVNLKPLDPSVIQFHYTGKGIIKHYEQISKMAGKKNHIIKPHNMFHLPRNRVGDQIHGTGIIDRLTWIILAKNEAMADNKILYHRFVVPRWIIKLSTEDPAEIATEKAKWDAANKLGENMYIPMGSVEVEQMTIAPNSTLNSGAWIESLDNKFYEAANCPKIIVGGIGGITNAAVKVAYLAWQQTIEQKQLFIEEQVLSQLNLEIELEFPASLENELLAANQKDATSGASQPNETTAGSGQ